MSLAGTGEPPLTSDGSDGEGRPREWFRMGCVEYEVAHLGPDSEEAPLPEGGEQAATTPGAPGDKGAVASVDGVRDACDACGAWGICGACAPSGA